MPSVINGSESDTRKSPIGRTDRKSHSFLHHALKGIVRVANIGKLVEFAADAVAAEVRAHRQLILGSQRTRDEIQGENMQHTQ